MKSHRTMTLAVWTVAWLATLAMAPLAWGLIKLDENGLPSTGPVIVEEPPEDPTQPPRQPGSPVPSEKTTTSMTLQWLDRSSYEVGNELQRSLPGGAWTTVATFGALTGVNSYTNTGLNPDTIYCYRVRAYNTHGESFSGAPCYSTRDPRRVWRLQIMFHTADVSDAGTDDGVRVRLSPLNETWLDYGRDDFERGDVFTYDLNLDNVSDLSDITTLEIYKDDDNGWCIQEFTLLVNGVPIYNQYFGATSSTCHWVDWGDGHSPYYTVSRQTLRAHALWLNYTPPDLAELIETGQPLIPREEIESRIESMVGHRIHDTGAYWGHRYGARYVEATKTDEQTMHIDLDLSADVTLAPDPEVDVDFDLQFSLACSADKLKLDVAMLNPNISSDFDWWIELLTIGLINLGEDSIAGRFEKAFGAIGVSISVDSGGVCNCQAVPGDSASVSVFVPAQNARVVLTIGVHNDVSMHIDITGFTSANETCPGTGTSFPGTVLGTGTLQVPLQTSDAGKVISKPPIAAGIVGAAASVGTSRAPQPSQPLLPRSLLK